MSDTFNQGVSGQNITISGQNVAVGTNSRVEQNISTGPFSAPLADLRSAIEAFDGPPDTRQALLATNAEVTHELEAPAPDKDKLLAKLASLKELAGPAAAIAQAVTALAQVVVAFF
ncbi:MAG TPA: hypothetical protein VIJ50_14195 [Solirubrobacteraceae bacterium]